MQRAPAYYPLLPDLSRAIQHLNAVVAVWACMLKVQLYRLIAAITPQNRGRRVKSCVAVVIRSNLRGKPHLDASHSVFVVCVIRVR